MQFIILLSLVFKLANWWLYLLTLHVFLVKLVFLTHGFRQDLWFAFSSLFVSSLKLMSLPIFNQRSRCYWRYQRSFCVSLPKNCFSFFQLIEEMHLWPTLKLRNSFKSTSQKRFQRTNSGKQRQSNQQKLLDGGDNESFSPEMNSSGVFGVVCRDVAMVLSCCFCCFCCGSNKPSWHFSP